MDQYFFNTVAVETFGLFAPQFLNFTQEVDKRLEKETNEPIATTFLIQQVSIAVQRGNATSVVGTIPTTLPTEGRFLKTWSKLKKCMDLLLGRFRGR